MLSFDDRDTWWPRLATALDQHAGATVRATVAATSHEFYDDACDLLLSSSNRAAVLDAVVEWIQATSIAAYHGSRLTETEVQSVRADGLKPLNHLSRKARLERALSHHPEWPAVSGSLDRSLRQHGPGGKAGAREGRVDLTLSRRGLVEGFKHYLTHGSEFDRHVAYDLLGDEGLEMLRKDGRARVVVLEIPGGLALAAANRYVSVDDRLRQGEAPNLARELLQAWSYGLAAPGFDYSALHVDCGLIFSSTVPPAWIVEIDTLPL